MLAPSALLREAVDDVDWAAAGGRVRVRLTRDPPSATVSAASAVGALDVALPPSALAAFDMPFVEVEAAYRYRHVKAACGGASSHRGAGGGHHHRSGDGAPPPPLVSSKLAIDGVGVLRVVHMVPVEGGGGERGGGGATAVIQFVVLPEADLADDSD